MRLFIGIELPDVLRDNVAAIASRVREDIARSAPDAEVRWVPASNLHITVWFLGEVREPRVEALVAALTPTLDARSFTLRIGGGGAFPPTGAPRAIWLGLASGREGLIAVHEQLRGRLVPLGFAARVPAVFPAPDHRAGQRCSSARRTSDARPSRGSGGRCRRVRGRVCDAFRQSADADRG